MPDPGDPITSTTPRVFPTANVFQRFYGRPLASSYHLSTSGGSLVVVDIPGPDGGPPSWRCGGCGASEQYGGDASELTTMGSAGTHAVRCGRDLDAVLDTELATVRNEGLRVDPKASGYLQVAGILASAGFAVLATGAGRGLTGLAAAAGVVTAVLVLAAVVLLLLASRPRLGGSGIGFMAYADTDASTILTRLTPATGAALTPLHKARELRWRSELVRGKYQQIRWAVPLLLAGFVGAAVTAVLAIWPPA